MDKVSVIIPVYNVEKYLARCFDSLINQTHKNIEIIPVDDNSPDKSREVILQYAKKVNCIFPILRDENKGVSASRNAGIEASTGEWLCFCDGDDWFEPEFVEKMLSKAKADNADFVVCDYQLAADGKESVAGGTVDAILDFGDRREVIAKGPLSSCTHLIKRDLFKKNNVRYPLGCAHFEELSVIPALAFFANNIAVIPDPLYNYYQRGDGTSASNSPKNIRDNFMISYNKLAEILGEGYEEELKFHAIYALLYGEILSLLKEGRKRSEIVAKIKEVEEFCPNYLKNKYIDSLGFAKIIFLCSVKARFVLLLRIFAKLHSMRVA